MNRKERFQYVMAYFRKERPFAETELSYADPYELLVSVILSAQCTDKRVNQTTPDFFKKYPTVQALAKASAEEIFPLIKSISYPNNKSKHLEGMGRMLVKKFNGIVPSEVAQLMEIPGVGRKTAHVIASVIFKQPVLAVDTHVFRVSARLGLTLGAKNPLQAEKQLMKFIPSPLVSIAHHWLILHGRYICKSRKPLCGKCGLKQFCKYYQHLQVKRPGMKPALKK